MKNRKVNPTYRPWHSARTTTVEAIFEHNFAGERPAPFSHAVGKCVLAGNATNFWCTSMDAFIESLESEERKTRKSVGRL